MPKPTKLLTLLFLRKNDQVLLAMKKRGFGEGRWNGVGGKLDAGESIEAAMIRETQEEIGVTPTSYEKVADIRFDELFKGEPTLMHVHVYLADKWDGEPTESEEMKPEWFTVGNIPYDDMWPDDPYWLPSVLEGHKISAEFTLDENDRITSHSVETVAKLPVYS
jgi:8-oxo-dGTP pyrophosphatase MutT (NUDIX family)